MKKWFVIFLILMGCKDAPMVSSRQDYEHQTDVDSLVFCYGGFLMGYMAKWETVTKEIDSTNQEIRDLYDKVLPTFVESFHMKWSDLSVSDQMKLMDSYIEICWSGNYVTIKGPPWKPSLRLFETKNPALRII